MDELVKKYFNLGLKHKEIVAQLSANDGVTISERHLKRILYRNNCFRRIHFSAIDDVSNFMQQELLKSGQMQGYRWMHLRCIQHGFVIQKEVVRSILGILDPVGVATRQKRCLRRRQYFSKGPNFLWHMDSYDKLKPFGICINGCIDGFSRHIVWLEAYMTSSDPKIIAGYYLNAVKECCGCPTIVRADMGTENGHVAQMQRFLRYNCDDNFSGERSFMYGKSTGNQRIEAWWSILRKQCSQFWLNIFHALKDKGYFTGSFLDKSLIQFCFMQLVQEELFEMKKVWNTHRIRRSRNHTVAYGIPFIMYTNPALYNTSDCLYAIHAEDVAICEEQCSERSLKPCDDVVYDCCVVLMNEFNYSMPNDAYDACNLYIQLRDEVLKRLDAL